MIPTLEFFAQQILPLSYGNWVLVALVFFFFFCDLMFLRLLSVGVI